MKLSVIGLMAMSVIAGAPTRASSQALPASQILVSASGMARTPPDMVTVGFTLRGEGATSDEAASRLRDTAKAMSTAIAGLLQNARDYHTSAYALAQVRAKECDATSYGQQRLSTGPCAIIGYIATLPVTVDTPRIADAGALVSLIGRLGGMDAGLRSFWLRDDTAARQRAMQAALASAQAQARSIAEGSGGLLGPLMRVQDADYREVSLDTATVGVAVAAPPAPPAPPPPPIRIDLSPDPIQTTVHLMAAYALAQR